MKKFGLFCMAIALVVGMSSCSAKQENNAGNAESENVVAEEQKVEINEIVNKDGKKFVPDFTTKGKISDMDLGGKTVELCGKTYAFPVKISALIADGWELSAGEFKNEFKAKTVTSLVSFAMKNKEDACIQITGAYNDTDSVQKLEDCWLTEFYMDALDKDTTKVDFVFPGGIVKGSTAGDVVSVCGDPNNTELFTDYSYNLDRQLTYSKHKDSGMSFTYIFNEDGTLNYAKISANVE